LVLIIRLNAIRKAVVVMYFDTLKFGVIKLSPEEWEVGNDARAGIVVFRLEVVSLNLVEIGDDTVEVICWNEPLEINEPDVRHRLSDNLPTNHP